MREFKTLECCCPLETLSETVSTVVADQATQGYTLYDQMTITKTDGDGAYSHTFLWFAKEE